MNSPSSRAVKARISAAAAAVKSWPLFAQVLVTLVLLAITAVPFLMWVLQFLGGYVDKRSTDLLQSVRHAAGPVPTSGLSHPSDIPTEIRERLDTQLHELRRGGHYHVKAVKTFFKYQFVTVSVAATCAVLAGVFLVPITWKGWKAAPAILTTLFLIFGGLAALFTTYNQVYNLEANVTTNTALYYGYLKLEDELLSYYPRKAANDSTLVPISTLIRQIDDRTAELRSFAVALNPNRIPAIAAVVQQINSAPSTTSDGK